MRAPLLFVSLTTHGFPTDNTFAPIFSSRENRHDWSRTRRASKMCKQVCQVTLPLASPTDFWFSGVEIRDSVAADRSNQRATQVERRDLQKRDEQGRDTKVKRFEISLQCSRVVVPRKSCLLFQGRSCVRGILLLYHVGRETKTTILVFYHDFPREIPVFFSYLVMF